MAEKLKKKINGHLGHFTKELDSWQKLMELATAIKSDRSIADMRKKQEKCEGILDTIRALTLEVNDLDPENVRNICRGPRVRRESSCRNDKERTRKGPIVK